MPRLRFGVVWPASWPVIPDWWEQFYFGSPTGAVANAEPDGDGYSNLQEYLAGTDPLAAASALKISAFSRDGNDYLISIPTVLGKAYSVWYRNDLVSGSWSNLPGATVGGTGHLMTIDDLNAAAQSKRFYQLRLVP